MLNKSAFASTVSITIAITLLYGYIYSQTTSDDFDFKDPLDPYYFSLMTMSTVGYGDFSPKSQRAKLLVMSQQTIILAEITAMVSKILSAKI
jgi:voltage-gated potassium channel|tara:strand:- start:325 stop:600 length:276 start_codon:yes stop_codon:yes gene_type:complete